MMLWKKRCKKTKTLFKKQDLRQEEDVLTLGFHLGCGPFLFLMERFPENKEIQYYYPTQDLVTGPDILFFWVARMLMSGFSFEISSLFKCISHMIGA